MQITTGHAMVYYLFKMTSINVEFKPAILLKVVESQMSKSCGRINGQSQSVQKVTASVHAKTRI